MDLQSSKVEDNLVGIDLICDSTTHFTTDEVFLSRDELTLWCKRTGRSCGVVVGIKKSDNAKYGRKARISYECERSGEYKPTKKHVNDAKSKPKRTGTKKCGCPFLLKGIKLPDDDNWTVEFVCGRHNHIVDKDATFEGHAFAGRLSKSEQPIVRDLSICGVKPREILRVLKQNDPENASTIDTIYNFKSKNRICGMQGRSKMQYLLKILDEKQYVEFHRRDQDTEELVDIFFAHPYSSQLLKCFPEVLMMDCTYKTNRHVLPLLEICGVTSTGKTFIVAHAYLRRENEPNLVWALQCLKNLLNSSKTPFVIVTDRDLALMNAISAVFPNATHLLCTWHISTNIEGHGKSLFKTAQEWEEFIRDVAALIESPDKESFIVSLTAFEEKYKMYKDLLAYINDTWLSKYKEHFVCAWTNSVLHFGNVTNNRAESQHAALKKYLGSSQGDLVSNFKMTHNLFISQHVAIRASFQKSLTYTMHRHRIQEFNHLRGFLSHDALDLILEEKKRGEYVGIDLSKCGCVIKRTHGLPCAHEIVRWKHEGHGIPLLSIDSRWKKLSDTPGTLLPISFDCEHAFSLVRNRIDGATEEQKHMILKLLLELGNPSSTNLEPPSKNTIVKGRPKLSTKKQADKDKKSTKRDPSLFEYAKTKDEKEANFVSLANKNKKIKMSTTRNKVKLESKGSFQKPFIMKKNDTCVPARLREPSNEYVDSILAEFDPKIKQHIIERIENVKGDGHCGYRCCAELLGLSHEDGWKTVRQRMLMELRIYKELHIGMLGTEQDYVEVETALDFFETDNVFLKYWMQLPAMGCLFATTFNCILCVLSPTQYTTYLPLRMGPTTDIQIIQMILYNNNHFMKFYWKVSAPIPHIIPGWKTHRYPDADIWAEIVYDLIDGWDDFFGFPKRSSLQSEVVDLG